ncbi:MAG: MopE-related protein [Myxococcota bacterium]
MSPGASESCNGVDDDCDGKTDDDDSDVSGQATWYRDADGDQHGDATTALAACAAPEGYVADDRDCDDDAATVSPDASETCNGVDDDCDGRSDDADDDTAGRTTWYRDADGDGHGAAADTTEACVMPAGYAADGSDYDDADARRQRHPHVAPRRRR